MNRNYFQFGCVYTKVHVIITMLCIPTFLLSFILVNNCLSGTDSPFVTGCFATIGEGARPLSIGAAFTAIADDVHAAFWNPAGLGYLKKHQFTGTYTDLYGLGLIRKGFIAYAQEDRGFGGGAVYWIYSSADLEPEKWAEHIIAYTIGKMLHPQLAIGGTIKALIVNSDFDNGDAKGFGVDIGILSPVTSRVKLGLNLRNFYSSLKWEAGTQERVPLKTHLGLAFQPVQQLILAAEIISGEESLLQRISTGGELRIFKLFALRTGIIQYLIANERIVFSCGIGIHYKLAAINYLIDYSYTMDEETLGNTHSFSIGSCF